MGLFHNCALCVTQINIPCQISNDPPWRFSLGDFFLRMYSVRLRLEEMSAAGARQHTAFHISNYCIDGSMNRGNKDCATHNKAAPFRMSFPYFQLRTVESPQGRNIYLTVPTPIMESILFYCIPDTTLAVATPPFQPATTQYQGPRDPETCTMTRWVFRHVKLSATLLAGFVFLRGGVDHLAEDAPCICVLMICDVETKSRHQFALSWRLNIIPVVLLAA
jgi:hypothetical protein